MSTALAGHAPLNRFHVKDYIGRGDLTAVYKVWDWERYIHLTWKLLPAHLAQDGGFIERFERDVQTLIRLRHPNIVRFYGLEAQDDQACLLLDYIEGTTLADDIIAADKPLTTARIMEIMRAVCSALIYAHHQDIIHGDLKPTNILIPEHGTPLVTDFGFARMVNAAAFTLGNRSSSAYLAPEQVVGALPTIQTDIYALGLILYELFTGGVRPAGLPSPYAVYPTIPPEFEPVILQCIAHNPQQRFASVKALLRELEHAAAQELVRKLSVRLRPNDTPALSLEIRQLPGLIIAATKIGDYQAIRELLGTIQRISLFDPPLPQSTRNVIWLVTAFIALIVLLQISS